MAGGFSGFLHERNGGINHEGNTEEENNGYVVFK
jgi:hypothetical protein